MKSVKFLVRMALISLTVFQAGCGLFWDDPYVTVTDNALNWLEVHYYNATREPVRRVSVRINGAGFVEVKAGTSHLVSDSFAKDPNRSEWDDIRVSKGNVSPAHVREIFQELVNYGLFDRDKFGRSTKYPSNGRFIAVRAAMENKTFSEPTNIFEDDPELAERLYNVVLEFKRPVLGRKKAKAQAEGEK